VDDFIRFDCRGCGKSIKVKANHAGKRVRCLSRGCGQTTLVPSPSPPESGPARLIWPWLVGGATGLILVLGLSGWYLTRGKSTPSASESPPFTAADKPSAKEPDEKRPKTPAPEKDGTTAPLDLLVGDWETPAFSLNIEKGGTGTYEWLFDGGAQIALVVGNLKVEVKGGKTFVSMSPTVFGRKKDYQFLAHLSGDKTTLDVEETNNEAKPRTLKRKSGTKVNPEDKGALESTLVDSNPLQGTWKLDSVKWAELDKTSSIYVTSKSYLIITNDEMTRRDEDDGKITETKYSYTLDQKKMPTVYEQKALDGKNKGDTFSGIYVIEGDTLKMCSLGKGLPDNFNIIQGEDVKDKYLSTYKKVKK
jgi:uncharacterized protein (TIGR03067 family)